MVHHKWVGVRCASALRRRGEWVARARAGCDNEVARHAPSKIIHYMSFTHFCLMCLTRTFVSCVSLHRGGTILNPNHCSSLLVQGRNNPKPQSLLFIISTCLLISYLSVTSSQTYIICRMKCTCVSGAFCGESFHNHEY